MSVTTIGSEIVPELCEREMELISAVWEHFFQTPVNPKVFGSERTDEPQILEVVRSLLQPVHIVTHSATTTSDAP